MEQPHRPQMTTRRMRFECRISKAKHIHTQLRNTFFFPLQQRLYEGASVLCYRYIVCLVRVKSVGFIYKVVQI
jgi:hypothetical protein